MVRVVTSNGTYVPRFGVRISLAILRSICAAVLSASAGSAFTHGEFVKSALTRLISIREPSTSLRAYPSAVAIAFNRQCRQTFAMQ